MREIGPRLRSLVLRVVAVVVAVLGLGLDEAAAEPDRRTGRVVAASPAPVGADVWDLYDRIGGHDRSGLPAEVRALLAVCDLRTEVGSGGFDLYLRYRGGDTATEALAALPAVLGPDWAEVLDAAMRTLGPEFPRDEYDRAERLDQRDLTARLDALDTRFAALESATDADAVMNAYLADHSG